LKPGAGKGDNAWFSTGLEDVQPTQASAKVKEVEKSMKTKSILFIKMTVLEYNWSRRLLDGKVRTVVSDTSEVFQQPPTTSHALRAEAACRSTVSY
jgi:hypothetical protein